MKAALLASPASPLVMCAAADVDCVDPVLDGPGPGQVRVQVTGEDHCGLCRGAHCDRRDHGRSVDAPIRWPSRNAAVA